MKLRLTVLLCALCGLTFGVATTTADRGNSANAQLCQQWQTLFDSNGGTFASQEACAEYAAQGNTIHTTNPTPYAQSKSDCESIGGTFSTDPATNVLANLIPFQDTVIWTCNGFPPPNGAAIVRIESIHETDCFVDVVRGLGWVLPDWASGEPPVLNGSFATTCAGVPIVS
jgi:hypothetical protein